MGYCDYSFMRYILDIIVILGFRSDYWEKRINYKIFFVIIFVDYGNERIML